MDSPSVAETVYNIACALYLKREFAIILPTGEREVVLRPATKHMVYKQLQCIYRESAPSRATIFGWLKRLEDTHPALVAYARGGRIAVRPNNLLPVEEASSAAVRKHRKDHGRYIAELQAQLDDLTHTLASLDNQVVVDGSTGKIVLQKEA
jgi:hypothetical protein